MLVVYGAEQSEVEALGLTVAEMRGYMRHVLGVSDRAFARVDGRRTREDQLLSDQSRLEFVIETGQKGVGRVWTVEQYCEEFGVTPAILNQQIKEGLKVMQLPDGTARITETAVDDFIREAGGHSLANQIANALTRIANHFDPPPADIIGTDYIATKLGCTVVWVAKMASEGTIPQNCIVPGTGNGKPWKFYRSRIDPWIEMR